MKSYSILLLFLTPLFLNAQEVWEHIYGGPEVDRAETVLNTSDGNLLVGGSSESFHPDDRWAYLSKLDQSGNILWEKTFNEESFWNIIHDVTEMPNDEGFLAVGATWWNPCAAGVTLLIRVDNLGDTLWTKPLCLDDNSYAYSITPTNDGNYLLTGQPFVSSKDIQLTKIDPDGNELWTHAYVYPYWDGPGQVVQTQDGGFAVSGYIAISANGQTDGIVIKTDGAGNELWTTTIGGDEDESFIDILELENEELLTLGWRYEMGGTKTELFLTRFSSTGDSLWSNSYGLEDYFDLPTRIIPTSDNGYAIIGYRSENNFTNERDFLLIKLDADFNVLWERLYGGDEEDRPRSIIETPDGGYCIVGQSKSFGDINDDIYIIKTDSLGNSSRNLLKGTTFFDEDESCDFDSLSELGLSGIKIDILGTNSISRLSNSTGVYKSLMDTGSFEIVPSTVYPYLEFCGFPQMVDFENANETICLDIPLQATVDCPFLTIDISVPFIRRCFENNIYVSFCNYGTITAESPIVEITLDPDFIYNFSTGNLVDQIDNVYFFELDDLDIWECGSFIINADLDCDAEIGATHCIGAHIFPDSLCTPEADSLFLITECRPNIGSYDPNDKMGYPLGFGPEHIIEVETELKYQIRFQNTGTDTAFNVVIRDTIPIELNLNTLRLGASSHVYELDFVDDRVLQWTFENILLPDSLTNDGASKGFINYFVEPYPYLTLGTIVENRAAIYFDFNEAVLTEYAWHTIGEITTTILDPVLSKSAFDFSIYPNPSSGATFIEINNQNTIEGYGKIIDLNGRILRDFQYDNSTFILETESLSTGIYFIKLFNIKGEVKTKKLVKL